MVIGYRAARPSDSGDLALLWGCRLWWLDADAAALQPEHAPLAEASKKTARKMIAASTIGCR